VFASRVVVVDVNRLLEPLRDQLAGFVAGLEPGVYSGADAAGMVAVLVEIERLAGAGKALLAARVADSSVWAGV
jgi:O-acetylhomoserine/O-acetylserine sulfhydrylase-like pyridoxal-dependent enzyme